MSTLIHIRLVRAKARNNYTPRQLRTLLETEERKWCRLNEGQNPEFDARDSAVVLVLTAKPADVYMPGYVTPRGELVPTHFPI
jgi:hypothetical protein